VRAIDAAPEVVGSFVTALGAGVAVVAGRVWEKRREPEQARRERIAPTYSQLGAVFWNAMQGGEVNEEFFHDWARHVLLWGPAA
jgi:hypothetical protein